MSRKTLLWAGPRGTGLVALVPQLAPLLLALLAPSSSLADDFPGFTHEAPAQVAPGEAVELVIEMEAPDEVRRARVRFRTAGSDAFDKVDMAIEGARLVATLPGAKVQAPGLEYYAVVQLKGGDVKVVFADPSFPHRVEVGGASAPPVEEDEPASGEGAASEPGAGEVPAGEPAPPPDAEGEFVAGRGPRTEGRRIPGAGGGGDPFLDEMAAFAAEDPTSMVMGAAAGRVAFQSVSVVEREDIERLGARSLLDVLAILPGVSTSRDVLGFDRVALRGLRGDARVAVLVDGHRMNNPYDGRVLWDLPADLIERVEVVRGPLAAAAEGPALAGAVLVTTRRAEGLSAHAYGGSFLTAGGSASGGLRAGDLEVHGGGHLAYTEGPRLRVEEDSFTRSGVERGPEDLRTYADELTGTLTLGASYRLSGGLGARLFGQALVAGEARGPYVGVFDTVGEGSSLSWITWAADAGIEIPIGDLGSVTTRAYADQHLVDRALQLSPKGYFTPDRDGDGNLEKFDDGVLAHVGYATLSLGAESELSLSFFEGNTFRIGLGAGLSAIPPGTYLLEMNRGLEGATQGLGPVDGLALDENGPCNFYGGELGALGACRLSLSLYASDEWRLLPQLSVLLGLGLVSFSDAEWSALTHLRPSAGVVYSPVEGLSLRVMGSGGVRPPTWEERYEKLALAYIDFSAGGYVGNPALVPESQLSLEVGADYRFSLLGVGYALSSTAFASSVGDAIERVDLTGNVEQPGNRGGYDLFGAEAEARAEFPGGSAAFVNVSWYRGYFRAPVDLDPDEPPCALYPWDADAERCTLITHVPQLRANVGLHLALGALGGVMAWTEIHSARQNNARSALERLRPYHIPAFALVNLSYRSPRLFDVVGLEARVFNLLDTAHIDDVPRPDRMTGLLPREGVAVYGGLVMDL